MHRSFDRILGLGSACCNSLKVLKYTNHIPEFDIGEIQHVRYDTSFGMMIFIEIAQFRGLGQVKKKMLRRLAVRDS
jgi:hypothetical protein